MPILWVVIRIIAIWLLVAGAVGTALTGVDLYLLLSGQIVPGEPIHPDRLAPSYLHSVLALSGSLAVLGASSLLSRFARRADRSNTQATLLAETSSRG
ncbi:hypothetical protein C7S18_06380 [Ahniella affigens]|uniref:Uncharacterized protein n=1 Tax=Ahniella affigens TaxID=2021234 RepID=A0A2P1PPS7_9GAMM|nr:hypothetical protein C7S18_06380 [Ahniella affigens]